MSYKWNDPEMKVIIKGCIRRAFRQSPQFREAMHKSRREFPPLKKKDGKPGKRPVVRYECEICKNLFPQKWIQVDHIEPAIPLDREETDLSYDELVEGICCDINNLQAICSTPMKDNGLVPSCHREKTNQENFIRRAFKDLKEKDQTVELTQVLIEQLILDYAKYKIDKALGKIKRKKKK